MGDRVMDVLCSDRGSAGALRYRGQRPCRSLEPHDPYASRLLLVLGRSDAGDLLGRPPFSHPRHSASAKSIDTHRIVDPVHTFAWCVSIAVLSLGLSHHGQSWLADDVC